jgi:hypothetical protein
LGEIDAGAGDDDMYLYVNTAEAIQLLVLPDLVIRFLRMVSNTRFSI